MKRVLAGLALGVLSLDGAAAADIPLKAPRLQPVHDWTGLYFGAHAGFGRGHSNAVLSDPSIATTSNSFGGPIGGLQAGYNVQLPSRIVLGFEADVSFPNYINSNSIISMLATANSYVVEQMDFTGIRARPSRLCRGAMAVLCNRRPRVCWRALFQYACHRQRRKETGHAARLGRGRRR